MSSRNDTTQFNPATWTQSTCRILCLILLLLISFQTTNARLSAQVKELPSRARDQVVRSGKQNFENQLLMRELQLLRSHAPTAQHLDLADYQIEKLKEIDQKFQKNVGELGRQGSLKITQRAEKIQDLMDETEQQLSEVLLPDQQKRLRQIAVQSFGAAQGQDVLPVFNLLGNPDFRSYLEISEPTAKRLRLKMQEENQALQKKIAELKSQSNDAVLSILSEKEKERLSDLVGEPFAFGKTTDSDSPGLQDKQDK